MGLRENEFEEELWQAVQDLTFGTDIRSCPQCRGGTQTARGDRSGVEA